MSDDIYYYDDNNNGGGGLLILVTLLLVPVIPAGDIAIYLIDRYVENAPNIVYIVGWLGFAAGWGIIWYRLLYSLFEQLWVVVFFLYMQGIIFIFLIAETEYSGYSKFAASLLYAIFIGKG